MPDNWVFRENLVFMALSFFSTLKKPQLKGKNPSLWLAFGLRIYLKSGMGWGLGHKMSFFLPCGSTSRAASFCPYLRKLWRRTVLWSSRWNWKPALGGGWTWLQADSSVLPHGSPFLRSQGREWGSSAKTGMGPQVWSNEYATQFKIKKFFQCFRQNTTPYIKLFFLLFFIKIRLDNSFNLYHQSHQHRQLL